MKQRFSVPPWAVLVLATTLFLVAVIFVFVVRGMHRVPLAPTWDVPEAEPERGRVAMIEHGCGSCHVIPGIRGADARVGPRLIGLSEQSYIAGVLPNTPYNLIRWIQDPQTINPLTAMPTLEVSESEARDIAAYLYTITE